MAKCTSCGQRKGKRTCPALAGSICSLCCGEKRQRDIDCPEGCSYLGDVAPRRREAFRKGLGKLFDFALKWRGWGRGAADSFVGKDREIEDWEMDSFLEYLAYGHVDENGDRLLDIFLRNEDAGLRREEREALETLQEAWFSLFEAQEVRAEEGIELADVITGETFSVREKLGTSSVRKFGLLLAWVVWLDDHYELTGAAVEVPRTHREVVEKAIRGALKKAKRARPGSPEKVLLRATVGPAHRALREAVRQWRPPSIITTMDGEEIVFCKAIFDVTDEGAVLVGLERCPDVEGRDDHYTWLDRKGRKALGSGPLILGSIRVAKARLVLETTSRERLERGKVFLTELLGAAVHHRLDSMKDLDVAMEEHRAAPPRQRDKRVPPEVEAEIVRAHLRDHLQGWVDTELPALDGLTPRRAVRTKKGREEVIAMLKDQEHMAQRMPGGDGVDFSVVHRELGIGGDPVDALEHTNRLGATYYLHEGRTKTGKPKYFAAKTVGPGALPAMPEGYEFSESINGVVSVRRIRSAGGSIPAKDVELVRTELSRHEHLRFHRVEERKGEIVIHEPVGDLTDEGFAKMAAAAFVSPFLMRRVAESRRAKARYTPLMKFVPARLGAQGTYVVSRMTYRGDGGWMELSVGSLSKLVKTYLKPIGTDAFFELM